MKFCVYMFGSLEVRTTQKLDSQAIIGAVFEKCHEKRDEARKKLKECLARKAELKKKILKAKQGSLVQEIEANAEAADLEAEATEALHALHKGNVELSSAIDDLKAASSEEASHINEMVAQSAAADTAMEQCAAEDEAEAKAQAGGTKGIERLKKVLRDLASAAADTAMEQCAAEDEAE